MAQCLDDRIPQGGISGETGFVAEDPEGIGLVPGAREALERGLDGGGEVGVACVTVGEKGVVAQVGSPRGTGDSSSHWTASFHEAVHAKYDITN